MKPMFLKGALVGGIAGALMAAGTVALASTSNFILGSTTANTPNALTAVTAQNADGTGGLNGKMIQLTNNSTGSSTTALGLTVGSGRPPLTVNSGTKVTNLNADKLDSIDSTGFVKTAKPATGTLVGEAWHAVTAFDVCLGSCPTTSWVNYGASYNTVGYCKDPLGVVHLKGLVKWNQASGPTGGCEIWSLFQLPAGYRPGATEIRATLRNDTLSRIES